MSSASPNGTKAASSRRTTPSVADALTRGGIREGIMRIRKGVPLWLSAKLEGEVLSVCNCQIYMVCIFLLTCPFPLIRLLWSSSGASASQLPASRVHRQGEVEPGWAWVDSARIYI